MYMVEVVEGVVQSCNVGMMEGRKVKYIVLEGSEEVYILDGAFDRFDCATIGTNISATVYLEEEVDLNWYIDTFTIH